MDEEDMGKMLESLRRGRDKLEQLKKEQEKLLEANRKLVQLVEGLEEVMEYVEGNLEGTEFSMEGHVYDFDRGWTPKKVMVEENLEIDPDIDSDEIDAQLDQIRDMIKTVENYKNQEKGS